MVGSSRVPARSCGRAGRVRLELYARAFGFAREEEADTVRMKCPRKRLLPQRSRAFRRTFAVVVQFKAAKMTVSRAKTARYKQARPIVARAGERWLA